MQSEFIVSLEDIKENKVYLQHCLHETILLPVSSPKCTPLIYFVFKCFSCHCSNITIHMHVLIKYFDLMKENISLLLLLLFF